MKKLILASLLLAAGLFFVACDDDPTDVGLGVQPDDALELFVADTFELYAHSILVDSLRSDETSYNFLGSHFDPIFGVTTAAFNTTFALSSSDQDYEDVTIDSLIMMLEYYDYVGDTTTTLALHIYELIDSIPYDSSYYTNHMFDYDESFDYAQGFEFAPQPTTEVLIDTDTTYEDPHLRIPMPQELIDILTSADSDDMESTSNFVSYFKGLTFQVDKITQSGAGSVVSFDLTTSNSRLRMYYHDDEDTTYFDYTIGDATPRTNYIDHYDYVDADPELRQQVIDGDTTLGQQKFYCQSLGGIRAVIRIPGLDSIEENIVINDASLIATSIDEGDYEEPDQMYMYGLMDGDTLYELDDYAEGTSYFGGIPDEGQTDFRLSILVQNILTDKADSHSVLMGVSSEAATMNRIIFNGPEAINDNLKLRLVYTVVD